MGFRACIVQTLIETSIPMLMIDDATVMESSGEIMFMVRLNMASSKVVTARCGTLDGTATMGEDYTEFTYQAREAQQF